VPGLALAALIASLGMWIGSLVPLVGAPVSGIAAGIAAGWALRRAVPDRFARLLPGLAVAGRQVLQGAIVVLGLGLPLTDVLAVGGDTLPIMLGTLGTALAGAWLLGRLLRLHPETTLLIGVGTGICGASAIAAATAVARPAQERVAQALGTIFTFNLLAVLVYPPLGHLLGLSPEGFGLWAGTAINDTSSVVAAAHTFGATAGDHAVVVKPARSLMIIPICLVLYMWRVRRGGGAPVPPDVPPHAQPRRWACGRPLRVFPLFIVAFLAASALAAVGVTPQSWLPALSWLGTFAITTALAGIGLALAAYPVNDSSHSTTVRR
jgi:uncharacterized integral membrane protein (TIGR00698 family)